MTPETETKDVPEPTITDVMKRLDDIQALCRGIQAEANNARIVANDRKAVSRRIYR